ncbi:MAG: hypothetical protein AAB727_00045, partial [Patescibacteria group bacterium]
MSAEECQRRLQGLVNRWFDEADRHRALSVCEGINNLLRTHIGELVLVVERAEEPVARRYGGPQSNGVVHMMPPQDRFYLKETHYVGLVSGPALSADDRGVLGGQILIPTKEHYTFGGDFKIFPEKRDGGITPSQFGTFAVDLVQKKKIRSDFFALRRGNAVLAAQIVVGDEDVTRWFMDHQDISGRGHVHSWKILMLWTLCRLLAHDLPIFSAVKESVRKYKELLQQHRLIRKKMEAREQEVAEV